MRRNILFLLVCGWTLAACGKGGGASSLDGGDPGPDQPPITTKPDAAQSTPDCHFYGTCLSDASVRDARPDSQTQNPPDTGTPPPPPACDNWVDGLINADPRDGINHAGWVKICTSVSRAEKLGNCNTVFECMRASDAWCQDQGFAAGAGTLNGDATARVVCFAAAALSGGRRAATLAELDGVSSADPTVNDTTIQTRFGQSVIHNWCKKNDSGNNGVGPIGLAAGSAAFVCLKPYVATNYAHDGADGFYGASGPCRLVKDGLEPYVSSLACSAKVDSTAQSTHRFDSGTEPLLKAGYGPVDFNDTGVAFLGF